MYVYGDRGLGVDYNSRNTVPDTAERTWNITITFLHHHVGIYSTFQNVFNILLPSDFSLIYSNLLCDLPLEICIYSFSRLYTELLVRDTSFISAGGLQPDLLFNPPASPSVFNRHIKRTTEL